MNQKDAYLFRKSHEHNDKDDFRTPMYLIKYLKNQFGPHLRDAACSEENKKGEYINIFDPSIELKAEEWVYINPPFDTPSILKFIEASKNVNNNMVYLLPNKLCQKSFTTNVNYYFDEVIMLGGRINFISPYAVKGGTSMNGCFFGIIYADLSEKNEYPLIKSINLSDIKKRYYSND
tara:strand:+ start:1526 stop:2056 length:531 start_codon:yes stop_codon:yes gene_type:complete